MVAGTETPYPRGFPILTTGLLIYPDPLSEITIELIVPAADTIAVAEAATFVSCDESHLIWFLFLI